MLSVIFFFYTPRFLWTNTIDVVYLLYNHEFRTDLREARRYLFTQEYVVEFMFHSGTLKYMKILDTIVSKPEMRRNLMMKVNYAMEI
jgi:hypothetical protein